ncbi:MAG TPA: carboxymuconolactone decarboxylase family protein [Saprospiraceae bacterium]|nr:carboxymuconolactone decarboxylase family protein [Saprospiraceae bacterium]
MERSKTTSKHILTLKISTMSGVQDFNEYRQRMNDVILGQDNKVIKRFFSLDNQTYEDGALSEVTKELLGLVASMVLRCDDCIKYHLGRCHELGVTREQIYEASSVALVVGGSIFVPHMRRAAEFWEELEKG